MRPRRREMSGLPAQAAALLLGGLSFLSPAFAFSADGSGNVAGPDFGNPTVGSPCSYTFDEVLMSGSCSAVIDVAPLVSTSGSASSSVDAAGLHAYASGTVALSSPVDYPITASASANANYADRLTFSPLAPFEGYVDLTWSVHGSGGSMQSYAYVQDFDGAGLVSCSLDGAGSCKIHQLVYFQGGAGIGAGLTVNALAEVLRSGSGATVVSDYSDGAFVSALSFDDIDGNPIALDYTTNSGYVYPMAESVPEPGPSVLLLAGLGITLVRGTRRYARPLTGLLP